MFLCVCRASNCELELAPGPGVRKSAKRDEEMKKKKKQAGALNRTKQSETNGNVTVYKKKEVWSRKK